MEYTMNRFHKRAHDAHDEHWGDIFTDMFDEAVPEHERYKTFREPHISVTVGRFTSLKRSGTLLTSEWEGYFALTDLDTGEVLAYIRDARTAPLFRTAEWRLSGMMTLDGKPLYVQKRSDPEPLEVGQILTVEVHHART